MSLTFLSTSQVADIFKVNRVTVYRWVKGGKIKAFEVGKHLKIPFSEIRRLFHLFGFSEEEIHAVTQRFVVEEPGVGDALSATETTGNKRVVVVDADNETREFFHRLFHMTDLKSRGELVTCSDGLEAAVQIGKAKPVLVIVGQLDSEKAGHDLVDTVRSTYDDVLIASMLSCCERGEEEQEKDNGKRPLDIHDAYAFMINALDESVGTAASLLS